MAQNIQIKANDESLHGRYSNMMQVSHNKEEFILDFMNVLPPAGILAARIITSPGHAKRIARALAQNIEQYEKSHGKIVESENPTPQIGFETNN